MIGRALYLPIRMALNALDLLIFGLAGITLAILLVQLR
jgi:hypothetical protein